MLGKRYNHRCFKYVRDSKLENKIQFQVEEDDLSILIHQLEVIILEKLRGLEEIPFNSDIHPYINVYMQVIIELLGSDEKANQEAGKECVWRLERRGVEKRVLYFILYEALFRVQIAQRTLSEGEKLSFLQAIFETKSGLKYFVSQYIKYYEYLSYDYFALYEECIQDLCMFAGRICKIGPEINVNEEKAFTKTLYRAISFSGDEGDLGYAYKGLTILQTHINQIPDDLLIIQLLNHYDDRFLTSDRMAQKQIKAITRGYSFSQDKAENLLITEQIEAFYLNRRYIENYINQTLINHQYSQAKGSYVVDEEAATLEIIGGKVDDIMQTRLEKRLATVRDENEQIHAEIISKYEGFRNVKIQLLGKGRKDNPHQTISLVIEKEQVIIKNKNETIAYFNPKTFFANPETRQKVLESLNKNIAQIFGQKGYQEGRQQGYQEGEVLYLWINQYKGITIPQEINLSGQYHFAYNKVSGVLEVQSKDVPKVKNFYNVLGPKEQAKLHVLNGIIGKNGTGKTTLVDFIKNKLNKDAQGEYDFILAYKKNDKVACFYNFKDKDQRLKLVTGDEAVYLAREHDMPSWLDQTNIIYFSNIMNLNQRIQSTFNNERGHNLIDISTSSLYEKEVNGPEKYFYSYDIARQTLFLIDYMDKKIPLNLEEKDFKVPEYFIVGIRYIEEKISQREWYDKILEKAREKIQSKSLRDKFEYTLSEGSEGCIKFKLLFQEEKEEIRQFIKLYFQKALPKEIFFEFTPLSSGQTARLILYSRFYWITRQAEEYREWGIEDYLVGEAFSLAKHVIILVDEGETFFHPEWQRRYIYDLIYFLQVIFKDYEATESIQLIITSNSPLVISDLLEGNIAFLGKMAADKMEEEENKTFAQNIYLLFRDTFFMERGVTGEFARMKINQLVKEIQNEERERDELREKEIEFIIESIGEPLIKQKLLTLFNERRSKESQLAYYERRIQEIKEQLNKG